MGQRTVYSGAGQDARSPSPDLPARATSAFEEIFRRAFEVSPDAIALTSMRDSRLLAVNAAFERLTGWSRDEVLGRTTLELGIFPSNEERARLVGLLEAGQSFSGQEMAIARKSGETIAGSGSGAILEVGGERILVTLVQDASERKRAEARLQELNSTLKASDQRKSEVMVALSHELRNPLTAIRASIALLAKNPSHARAPKLTEIIERQSRHLARLVDDLLDLSRIERHKLLLQTERIDLRELVRRSVEDHQADLEGLALSVENPAAPVWIRGDVTRLAQVLDNLVHNASKFTPRGGWVKLSLATEGDAFARLVIADSGQGLDADELARVFRPFFQGARNPRDGREGLGLGLALVKGLVERHGGSIEARSEGPGRGTAFMLRLPLDGQA